MKRYRNAFLTVIFFGLTGYSQAAETALARALTMHASFDESFDADFSKGDRSCYLQEAGSLVPCKENDALKRTAEAGVSGSGLWFTKSSKTMPLFLGKDVLGYNAESWSASVSLWLRLTPDLDLAPGYCDPIQIIGNDSQKGFIFLEWFSKNGEPRPFRYAIRPLNELWNPKNLHWEEVENRPMVELKGAPFSREKWTHVVFTIDRVNQGKAASGALYIDGKHQGDIKDHPLVFGWDAASVKPRADGTGGLNAP
jgi:hypothetical protein